MEALTTTHKVNHTNRVFTLTALNTGEKVAADLIARGFDGVEYIGFAPPEGRKKERHGLFYREAKSGAFVFVA